MNREGPAPSATLAADQRIRERIASGRPTVHLAFGEAGLPVPEPVLEVLARAGHRNAYGPVTGSPEARAAAAGYFMRRRLTTDPEQIVFAPGSKALLWALVCTLPGDVVLPRPCWVSYAAHAALAGRRVWSVPIGAASGGLPDPGALEETLARARAEGGHPGVLIVTLPDNPTGTAAGGAQVERVAEIAAAHGLAVISDEIYRDLAHDPDAICSPAELLPERTYVTSGLSKSMALGGWRIGFTRLPGGPAGRETRARLTAVASEVWSSLPAPMQVVAAHVLDEPAEVTEHIAASRRLHRLTTQAAHRRVTAAGALCREPGGGFYLYPDLEPARGRLKARGIDGADTLAERLLEEFGIGVLTGTAFGDEPAGLRFRMATSLLYGDTDDERRRTLQSDDPIRLPTIARPLDALEAALRDLSGADAI